MKYLVNRETKEHLNYDAVHPWFNAVGWEIVYADDDGWIPWDGGECPLPDGTSYESLCYRKNDVRCLNEAPRGCWEYLSYLRDGCIKAYRPIVDSESYSDPLPIDENRDIFAELREAVEFAAIVSELISEINAMLPEGYEVTRK